MYLYKHQPIETYMCYTTGIFVCMYVISSKDGVDHQLNFSERIFLYMQSGNSLF